MSSSKQLSLLDRIVLEARRAEEAAQRILPQDPAQALCEARERLLKAVRQARLSGDERAAAAFDQAYREIALAARNPAVQKVVLKDLLRTIQEAADFAERTQSPEAQADAPS